jgi:hypothetical protein
MCRQVHHRRFLALAYQVSQGVAACWEYQAYRDHRLWLEHVACFPMKNLLVWVLLTYGNLFHHNRIS